MTDTFAIVYAPNANAEKEKRLVQKMSNIIARINIGKFKIITNPDLPIDKYWQSHSKGSVNLVLGWGCHASPSSEILIPELHNLESLRQLIAIELFEREGLDGRVLEKPNINAGKYWSQNMKRNNQNLFFDGYFLQAKVPYGLKRISVGESFREDRSSMPLFVFEPGDPSEVEIVRMIFELFVGHDYNRTEICTLLNAQEVNAPLKSGIWNARTIKTILESPLYIGANQYRGYIKHDVFRPIIEKAIFY